ncbi:MAG: folate-binding protein [Thiomicrospira sp.]|jgi:folate-binding protein YgfZ|nr:folate-binding protein [Thiomicrospira sp.]
MNTQWHDFLIQQHAQFDAQGAVSQFQYPELERVLIKHGPVMASLAHHALIEVKGEDATGFLQGQLSNDILQVTEEKAQFSAYCDPQGQVLALFLIFKHQDAYYLSFDASLRDIILKRLSMFVMRSKVSLSEVSEQWIRFGFAGQFADLDIQRRLDTKLKKEMACTLSKETGLSQLIIIKVPGPFHRYELFAPLEQAIDAWQKLRYNGDVTNNRDWRLLNIASGLPEVTHATSAQHLAQSLNLDKLDVINFKKGCFPGQEIIARMHYRGKANKRMLRIHLNEQIDLQPGDSLELTDHNDKTHKLEVILANGDIFEGTLCLAVGNLKSLELAQGDLRSQRGAKANIEPLPYLLTDED